MSGLRLGLVIVTLLVVACRGPVATPEPVVGIVVGSGLGTDEQGHPRGQLTIETINDRYVTIYMSPDEMARYHLDDRYP